MTDRIKALTVVLEHDIRIDDCQPLIDAISMMRGVAEVQSLISQPGDYIARERARRDLEQKIMDVLRPEILK